MTFIFYQIIAAGLIFLTSLATAIYPIKVRAHPAHRPFLELADAFSSGIFLGAALFHMLPSAIDGFQTTVGSTHFPIAEAFCALGFLLLLFLERLGESGPHNNTPINSVPFMLAFILIIHALIEGAALGVNTILADAGVIFLAIIAHKSSESFALAIVLNRSQFSVRSAIMIVVLFSLMTPFGIAIGSWSTHFLAFKSGQLLTAGFNAFAAGTFLYMSTLHHINHHDRKHEGEGLREFFSLLVGFSIMAGIAFWV